MVDHPQYAMWKAQYEAEQAALDAKAALRAERELWRTTWREAWDEYEAHWREGQVKRPMPPWWHVRTWIRMLLGKDHTTGGG